MSLHARCRVATPANGTLASLTHAHRKVERLYTGNACNAWSELRACQHHPNTSSSLMVVVLMSMRKIMKVSQNIGGSAVPVDMPTDKVGMVLNDHLRITGQSGCTGLSIKQPTDCSPTISTATNSTTARATCGR